MDKVTVDDHIMWWSMRPKPGTLLGETWEQGCRQGYEWGQRDAANPPAAEGETPKITILHGSISLKCKPETIQFFVNRMVAVAVNDALEKLPGFNEFLGDVQHQLLDMKLDPPAWPPNMIRDLGDYDAALDSCVKWCADRLRELAALRREGAVNLWREAVIDELVVCHIYQSAHDSDPRKAINDLISYNCEIALDPSVSEQAANLRDTYKDAAHRSGVQGEQMASGIVIPPLSETSGMATTNAGAVTGGTEKLPEGIGCAESRSAEPVPEVAAPAPDADAGYWWCPHCKIEVGAYHVTFEELHEACGHPVDWKVPETAAPADGMPPEPLNVWVNAETFRIARTTDRLQEKFVEKADYDALRKWAGERAAECAFQKNASLALLNAKNIWVERSKQAEARAERAEKERDNLVDWQRALISEFQDKEYADGYCKEHINCYIASQIVQLRKRLGLTQQQLADKCGMAQERISVMENVNYSRWNTNTLLRLASAFGVGLVISFEPLEIVIKYIGSINRTRAYDSENAALSSDGAKGGAE